MDDLHKAAGLLASTTRAIALTGAGISVDSGIPDYRGKSGLWKKYDPMVVAHIETFRKNPHLYWEMRREVMQAFDAAKPNAGHIALAELEKMGVLRCVITQNVDNLHQEAGSKNVVEFHGNSKNLICIWCGRKYARDEVDPEIYPPICECGKILKPTTVFFGEPIPVEASIKAQEEAQNCDVLLVIGTSAVVAPASYIPATAKRFGAKIVEINIERTVLTDEITDIFLQGSSSVILPELIRAVAKLRHQKDA